MIQLPNSINNFSPNKVPNTSVSGDNLLKKEAITDSFFNKENSNTSTIKKGWLLGSALLALGGAILIAIKTKKKPKIAEVQSMLSKIFDRNLQPQEAKEMALKYKEIFALEDNNAFVNQIFKQLQKDYKLPEIPFTVNIKDQQDSIAAFSHARGLIYSIKPSQIKKTGQNLSFESIDRKKVAEAFAHEMKHAKQYEIAARTNLDDFVQALAEREKSFSSGFYNRILGECGHDSTLALKKCKEELLEQLIPSYKALETYPVDSPLRQQGAKYIENLRNYLSPSTDFKAYKAQLLEAEAFDACEEFVRFIDKIQ